MKLFLILSIVLLMLTACPVYDPHYSGCGIFVENNSDLPIYICLTCQDSLSEYSELIKYEFWDAKATDEKGKQKTDTIYPNYRVVGKEKHFIPFYGSSKKKTDNCSDKKWRIFFIAEKTMREKTWNEIARQQLYEEKRISTQKELEDLNWTIDFNKEMK